MVVNVINKIENNVMFCVMNSLISIHFGMNATVGGIPLSNRMKKNTACIPIDFFSIDLFLIDLFLNTELMIATDIK
jgi:hypothetical protein